jgi:hypothetical protein
MENEDPSEHGRPGAHPASEARRRVLAAAVEVMSHHPADPPGGAYLTVLLDRLPMLATALYGLRDRTGTRTVAANLVDAAVAAMDFYGDALAACTAAFHSPGHVVALRRALLGNDVGPHRAYEPIAGYLSAEREHGRVNAGVDPLGAARLLAGGCVNHAFVELVLGDGVVPPRDTDAAYLVDALRLDPD